MPSGIYKRGSQALSIVRKFAPKVKKVRDADESITIEVLLKDASSSRKKDHLECAMAVACKRSMHLDGVIISRGRAYLIKDGVATRYMLPPSVSREVVSFDRGAGFEPGTYELSKPGKHERLGSERSGPLKDDRSHANKGVLRRSHLTQGIRTAIGGPGSKV